MIRAKSRHIFPKHTNIFGAQRFMNFVGYQYDLPVGGKRPSHRMWLALTVQNFCTTLFDIGLLTATEKISTYGWSAPDNLHNVT